MVLWVAFPEKGNSRPSSGGQGNPPEARTASDQHSQLPDDAWHLVGRRN